MSEGKPIPVRFSPEIRQRLEKTAKNMGISNRTALIKICVSSFLDYFEQEGVAGLPINWREILHELDGRTHRYKKLKVAESGVPYGEISGGKKGKEKSKP
jgi:hypothetical protein